MDPLRTSALIREWIIFALSFGLGGHVVLALMLHAPDRWPWSEAGARGLLVGLSVYVGVQLLRSAWWALGGKLGLNPWREKDSP